MKKYVLLFLVTFSFTAFAADKGTWTGYISDAHCGAKGNNDGHADCAKKCVKEGYAPVFVVGDKVYAISNPKRFSFYIADKVPITGAMTDDKLEIEKVTK